MNHPGSSLEKELRKSEMSRKELAIRTGVTEKHICTIINGDRDITVAFARKLGCVFHDTSYWLSLQEAYDEEQLRIQEEKDISPNEIELLRPLHEIVSYLIARNYLQSVSHEKNLVLQLRKLLKICNLTSIPNIAFSDAYQNQLSENANADPYVLFAWQRICEIETESIHTANEYNKCSLLSKIDKMKELMFGDIDDGIQPLQGLLSEAGIAFQVIKNFRGAPVQGYIGKRPDKSLSLCLSFRWQRADLFWNNLFHLIGHIINQDFTTRYTDFERNQSDSEKKADNFRNNTLIDPAQYKGFTLTRNDFSWKDICSFAQSMKIPPFMVLSRLQEDKILDWTDYPEEQVKYLWG